MTEHIVMFSGGIGSWAAAKRVAERHGTNNLTLLFTDTLIEDEDLYRFLDEAAANVGGRLIRIAEGRTPWEVFRDVRMLGNSGMDPCSRILKREVADKWLKEHCDPADAVVYLGIDWTEGHRFDDGEGGGAKNRYARNGWRAEAPMCEAPYTTKDRMLRHLAAEGIAPPRLYAMGFAHNNCGGWCCKAGQGHFAHLLRTMPERYAHHEAQEEAMRDYLGKDVSMMSDRSGGKGKKPLTMKSLRERIQAGGQVDMFEIGGCGCFMDDDREAAA
ncbi:MAG: hypothetical protein ACLGJC_09505 [Alphaproteobacteria bacterium]